ncbi:hypothetical protein KCP76_02315 [Salmonella enterica subsp. enterica serovar Weltevreden]|nr:hypothetical protein KCP76_02315 [Salmonella enterica subsp. enterica serovar Weltevreden]
MAIASLSPTCAPTPSAAAEIVSRNQRELLRRLSPAASGHGDGLLPRQPQPPFTQIFTVCNSSIRSCVWPVSKPRWNVYAPTDGICAGELSRPLSARQRVKSTRTSKSPQPHPRAVAHQQLEYRLTENITLTVKRTARAFRQRGHASGSGQPVIHAGARGYTVSTTTDGKRC